MDKDTIRETAEKIIKTFDLYDEQGAFVESIIRDVVKWERDRCIEACKSYLCYGCEADSNRPCDPCRKLKLALDRIRQGGE